MKTLLALLRSSMKGVAHWIAFAVALVTAPTLSAQEWAAERQITDIEALVNWQTNGAVRIVLSSAITSTASGCAGSHIVVDFMFSGGSLESRSATLSLIYAAAAANKTVKFWLSTGACSPANAPIVVGLHVIN